MGWLDGLSALFAAAPDSGAGIDTSGYSLMGNGADYWTGAPYRFNGSAGFDVSGDPNASPITAEPTIDITGRINSDYINQMSAPVVTRTDTSMAGRDPFSIRDSFRDASDPFGFKAGMPSLKDMLSQLARSGGSGGGGNNAVVTMPQIAAPTADKVPMVTMPAAQTGALPSAPPTAQGGGMAPMATSVPLAQTPADPQGLRRLFEQMGAR